MNYPLLGPTKHCTKLTCASTILKSRLSGDRPWLGLTHLHERVKRLRAREDAEGEARAGEVNGHIRCIRKA